MFFVHFKDKRTSRCSAAMVANVSNSTDYTGCWLTILTMNVVVYSATGSNFRAAVYAVATIYHWNFAYLRDRLEFYRNKNANLVSLENDRDEHYVDINNYRRLPDDPPQG